MRVVVFLIVLLASPSGLYSHGGGKVQTGCLKDCHNDRTAGGLPLP